MTAPTRMLHPAVDCYRGLGYRIVSHALERQAPAAGGATPGLVRCLVAEKKGRQVRVCENVVDAHGQSFTDASAWYWAAVMGRTQGPWLRSRGQRGCEEKQRGRPDPDGSEWTVAPGRPGALTRQ